MELPQVLPKPLPETQNLEQIDELEKLFQKLHQEKSQLCQYRGFWFDENLLSVLISFHKHFQSQENDIILATLPKAGTTWLSALTFSIVNRCRHSVAESPLLFNNPHQLVQSFHGKLGGNLNLENVEDRTPLIPRIFSTHFAYQCLPNTILQSSCKIIYICRNLLDVFTSVSHFSIENEMVSESNIDGFLETVFSGKHPFGPFCENMLGYWDASIKIPHKVLFLKYEDLRKDTSACIKKIAEFLECPFSAKEEKDGLVEEIKRLCSLENLKNLEVNKKGEIHWLIPYKKSSFFRKGKVGDWVNYLTPSMAERLQILMEEKFKGSGLAFEIYDKSG